MHAASQLVFTLSQLGHARRGSMVRGRRDTGLSRMLTTCKNSCRQHAAFCGRNSCDMIGTERKAGNDTIPRIIYGAVAPPFYCSVSVLKYFAWTARGTPTLLQAGLPRRVLANSRGASRNQQY